MCTWWTSFVGSKIVSFKKSNLNFNVSLNEDHIKLVMLHFDYDKDKTVSVSEVMKGIRDSLIAWGDSSRSSSPKLGLQTKTDDDSGLGPLPPWITKVKASSGRYYYKNHNTKTKIEKEVDQMVILTPAFSNVFGAP